ncbi:MAG: hypothetical protein B6226_01245 [Candidatus Cloacimonetes bacterium 4572_65]|nr:MAG: hypothetical protein B6226_01245 [Candidatus Cloacimonetes bacterium 4572_65]
MIKVYYPISRAEDNHDIVNNFSDKVASALKLAVIQLREKRRPNDHKFERIPTKHLWISDIGGRKGGRLLYFRRDGKLILWGLGPNHDIEDEAVRYFSNKIKEEAIFQEDLIDITHLYLSDSEEQKIKAKTKVFAGNISDDFLREKLYFSDYDIAQLRISNELSLWDLNISDAVKFKLMQYLKLPENVLLSARDEIHLEKFIEGSVDKLLIHLDDYQEKIVNQKMRKTLLLRGETGSGKTTILIYKAIFYAEANPLKECILFTYNIPLANLIKDAIQELTGSDLTNLQIFGVFEWIEEITLLDKDSLHLIERDQGIDIYEVLNSFYSETQRKRFRLSERKLNLFLKREIEDIIFSYGIKSLFDYKIFKRKGTEKRLGSVQRSIVWEIRNKLLEFLEEKSYSTFEVMALDFLDSVTSSEFLFKKDAIFVDEVQDLSPVIIKVISKLRKSSNSMVVIAGDYKQAIYRKSFSWNDVSLPFFGANVTILRMNYRNTKQILFSAHNMLANFLPNLSTPLHCGRSGRDIEFVEYSSSEKIDKIAGIIRYLNEVENLDLSEIAIFCCSNKSMNRLVSELYAINIPTTVVNSDKFLQAPNTVKISTLHSAKGLEFRAVILVDINKDLMSLVVANLN